MPLVTQLVDITSRGDRIRIPHRHVNLRSTSRETARATLGQRLRPIVAFIMCRTIQTNNRRRRPGRLAPCFS